jgi:hypothetical protein
MQLMNETVYPQPGRLKSWTDSDGKVWRRIGNVALDKKAVRRLIADPAVRVVLFDGPQPADVAPTARQELWDRMDPVMSGTWTGNPFAEFVCFRYRDEERAVLLAIEERW